MRAWSPSLKGVPLVGKLVYLAVILMIVFMTGYGLLTGYLDLSVMAVALIVPFVFVAPYVLGGRWRRPVPKPTRRPVVRRRRY